MDDLGRRGVAVALHMQSVEAELMRCIVLRDEHHAEEHRASLVSLFEAQVDLKIEQMRALLKGSAP